MVNRSDAHSPVISTPHFVGRDRELAALRDAVSRPPAIVLVEGEAGIGKSRLLQEWLAGEPDLTALVSVCPPLRESLTLGPIVDAFRGIDRLVAGLRSPTSRARCGRCFRSGRATCRPPSNPSTTRRPRDIGCSARSTSCSGRWAWTSSSWRTRTGPTR